MALASSISAATLAKALSGIDLPLSKENITKYVNNNISKMNQDLQSEISKVFFIRARGGNIRLDLKNGDFLILNPFFTRKLDEFHDEMNKILS